MSINYDKSQEYFATAYRTGSDVWSHIPFQAKAVELTDKLSPNAFILDLGSGRGLFPFQLVNEGFRVIGLELDGDIVLKNNSKVKEFDLGKKMRFMQGDALDAPFTENSFDAVIDIGLIQHLSLDDWEQYAGEVYRVMKPGGYYFLITLSNDTEKYMNWTPKKDIHGNYEYEGVPHHFFSEEEIKKLFENQFEIISMHIDHVLEYHNTAFIVSLMQKK